MKKTSNKQSKVNNAKQRTRGSQQRNYQASDMSYAKASSTKGAKAECDDRPGHGYTKPQATKVTDNDISWYNHSPELLKSAASLPFASIIGQGLSWTSGVPIQSVPGIMSIGWDPSIGGELNDNGAINQAATSTYSYLVHANSRNYTYEAADLMLAIMAGAEVFSILGAMIRAYGVAHKYSEANRYLPDGLLTAMGFQPDDIRKNFSRMWFDINLLIDRSKQIWIPNTMPFLMRRFWLNTTLFKDSSDVKGQIYVFVQNDYLSYQSTTIETGGALLETGCGPQPYTEFHPAEQQYTWDQWMSVAEYMLQKLLDEEDRGIMYGDILNAYGADHIYALPTITSDYTVEAVYSEEVLMQIENLVTSRSVTQCGVGQVEGLLVPIYKHAIITPTQPLEAGLPGVQALNFHFNTQPSPEAIMVATRAKTAGMVYIKAGNIIVSSSWNPDYQCRPANAIASSAKATDLRVSTCGTEICTSIRLWFRDLKRSSGPSKYFAWELIQCASQWATGDTDIATRAFLMSFDWHPFLYEVQSGPKDNPDFPSDTEELLYTGTVAAYGDYCNYTQISSANLERLHSVALYSEFGVPQM
nr:putative capsid [Marmot picobirnavirus]